MRWVGNAIGARLRYRMRQVERVRRQHTVRNRRTWTASCQANLMKLRYRHANPYQTNPYLHGWDLVVSHQIEKYALRLDPVNAWQKREFRIVEKMDAEEFRQDEGLVHGSAWTFAANMQSSKANRLMRGPRRRPAKRRWWFAVLHRGKIGGQARKFKEPGKPWHMAELSFVRTVHRVGDHQTWRNVVHQAWRRLMSPAQQGDTR